MDETHATAWERRGKPAAVCLLLLAVLGRALYVALPVNSDTAMFVYAGRLVQQGGRPGVDLLDNKLPSVGLLMSVPYRWLGASWPGYGVLGLLLALAATAVLARAAGRLWGPSAAWLVATAAAVWLNFPPVVYGQLQLEVIEVFFTAIAGACVLSLLRADDWRDAVTAGLSVGIAIWAKPTAGAVLVAAGVTLLAARRWRPVLWIGLGAALPVTLCLWLIVITGMSDALPDTLRQLHDYAANSTFDWVDATKPLVVLMALGFPPLVLWRACRRQATSYRPPTAEAVFVLLWLLAETAAVVAQRRMYAYHFLVLAPPAALATGLLARRVNARTLWMAFGPAVALTAWWVVSACVAWPATIRDDRLIAYLKANTRLADAVWADDYPRLLVETDRRPGSAVPLIFLFANSDRAPAYFTERLLEDFDRRRPVCVALPADPARLAGLYRHHMAEVAGSPQRADAIAAALARIQRYVETHYHAETDIGSVRVWRRNAGALAAAE